MKNYKKIDTNIYCCSNEYYVIKKNNKMYVYDYEHHLIFETKPIKNIIYGTFVNEDTVYFGSTMKRLIYRIKVEDKQVDRIRYTDFSYPDTYSVYKIKKNIYVFYSGYNEKCGEKYGSYEYALAILDEGTGNIKHNCILPYHTLSSFTINQKVYLTLQEISSNNYSKYFLYERDDESNKFIYEFSILGSERNMIISDNKKYMIIASVDSDRHLGQINIYDLIKNTIIDKITFEHVAEYGVVYHSFHYNNKDYVIFQANPVYCTYQDDIWHTYLYSIQDKKIIARYPSAFMIRYISKQKMMMVETANKLRKTDFYKVDDQKEDLFEVLDEVHKNVEAKSKKKKRNNAYFKECPFQKNKPYQEYTEQEAENLFQFFIEEIDERIECLFKVMSRFMDISLKYNYETLERVIDWYFDVSNAKYYMSKGLNLDNESIKKDEYVFTDLLCRTMAYIGIYIGKLIQCQEPEAIWKLDKDKNSQYYHQPYIEKPNGEKNYPLIYVETILTFLLDRKSVNLDEMLTFYKK